MDPVLPTDGDVPPDLSRASTVRDPIPDRTARPADAIKLVVVALIWLVLARYLDRVAAAALPDALKAKIRFQSFLMICQGTVFVAGLSLSWLLLARPRRALALVLPSARSLAATVLLAPASFVVATAVAIEVALPTLMAEAQARGPGVSRENAGAFGRTLEQGSLLPTLLWGVVLAAVTEEVLFRGALWAAVDRAVALVVGPGAAVGPIGTLRRTLPGFLATLVAGLVFSALHGDLRGGVGVVRLVSTLCLGLACGGARHLTGSVVAPIALHLVHNTLALGQARRWFASSSPPLLETLPIPDMVLGLAAAGTMGVLLLGAVTVVLRRQESMRTALAVPDSSG